MTRGLGGISPANIQKFLAGVSYPASRDDLIEHARGNRAPPDVMELIEGLPDQEFGGPQDVQKAYPEAEQSAGR